MKHLITIITAMLLFDFSLSGQTITIQEYISKTKCSGYSCFNDYITMKGFSADNSILKQPGEKFRYYYRSDKTFHATSNENMVSKNYASFIIFETGQIRLAFGTDVKAHYLNLINELKTLKFTDVKTEDEGNGQMAVTYKSSQYSNIFIVATSTILAKEGQEWTSYIIEVFRNN